MTKFLRVEKVLTEDDKIGIGMYRVFSTLGAFDQVFPHHEETRDSRPSVERDERLSNNVYHHNIRQSNYYFGFANLDQLLAWIPTASTYSGIQKMKKLNLVVSVYKATPQSHPPSFIEGDAQVIAHQDTMQRIASFKPHVLYRAPKKISQALKEEQA